MIYLIVVVILVFIIILLVGKIESQYAELSDLRQYLRKALRGDFESIENDVYEYFEELARR